MNHVEETISVDKKGRLVLPTYIRETLGLEQGGRVKLSLNGRKLILEPIHMDLKKSVEAWASKTKSQVNPMNSEKSQESWKWMNDEYSKKKLGFL
jgi:AbrB family looped-hinge helix DNA binding protein